MSALGQHLVLKEGKVFLLSQETGDISGHTGLGLYCRDIRFLSLFTLQVNGQAPPLLNFSGYRNFMGTLQFANDILHLPDGRIIMPQTISMRRSRFIRDGLHERVGFANYNRVPVPITLSLSFGADFRDIFDVRGFPRERWGELLPPAWEDGTLVLGYKALDEVARSTVITFDRPPHTVDVEMPSGDAHQVEPGIMVPVVGAPSYHIIINPPIARLHWNFLLEPTIPQWLSFHVMPHVEGDDRNDDLQGGPHAEQHHRYRGVSNELPAPAPGGGHFDKAVNYMRFSYYNWEIASTALSTDHEDFNALLKRSKYDLRVLSEPEGEGYFPSAGIPWYACPFGRDSLITALQTLCLNPQVAIGTLHLLARYQGKQDDQWREEQPGKILHELRVGEMAHLGIVPHSPYFGSVDATPLFVMLFVETMSWLDDDALFKNLLPNVLQAVEWIDKYGDVDGDGLVEYKSSTARTGIRNQVWKDSEDSMQFPDGNWAETPVAAVEVQAYVYAAKKGLSELLRRRGKAKHAKIAYRLGAQAEELKERFNKAFWMPDAGFFAQGLDKEKRHVPTITSNPGHCLWCGIIDADKARITVPRLMQPDMVSGWGVRTISDQSPSYNPMSYHNGSIWPHDNSILVAGLKRYGYHAEANTVVTQIVEAAQHFRYARLPELYCGFARDKVYHSGPTEYPVSCSPQAWAAGAPILMLQAMLGLQADASDRRVRLSPTLPEWLNTLWVSNLRVGDKRIDLRIDKQQDRNEVILAGGDTGIALEVQ